MNILSINNIYKSFGEIRALDGLTLELRENEIITLVGESGSGKSTLVHCVMGMTSADSGTIFFQGKDITAPTLVHEREGMKYVTQSNTLDNYSTVQDNVGKYLSNTDLIAKNRRIDQLLHAVSLEDKRSKKIVELSGGQAQRVAIARALAHMPQLLLLDEPFSNLDNSLKRSIRDPLFAAIRDMNMAILMTTHDIQDAFGYSDKVAVIKEGKILQIDTPKNIYDRPINEYVANLIDYVNIIESEFGKEFCYPTDIVLTEGNSAKIESSEFEGHSYIHTLAIPGGKIKVRTLKPYEVGQNVHFIIRKKRRFSL